MKVEKNNHINTEFGRHLLVEFWECEFAVLNDEARIRQSLVDAVYKGGAFLIDVCVHKFSPNGVTGAATLSESHICIHTWPENNYAAIDIFMCGKGDPYQSLQSLESNFQPKYKKIREVIRGIPDEEF